MTKRIISVLLSILMILSSMSLPAFAATEPAISFGDAVISGDEVKVPVKLNALPDTWTDLSAFTMEYTYSTDKLVYSDTESAALTIEGGNKTDGKVLWMSGDSTVTAVNDTVLFYLVFTKAAGASGEASVNAGFCEIATVGKSQQISGADTTFALDGVAKVSMGEAAVNGREVKIPVMLDKLPADISNIAAATIEYSYDSAVLAYKGTEAGLLDVATVTEAGKAYWTAKTGAEVTGEDVTLFTLIFEVAEGLADVETEVKITFAELGDDTPEVSKLVAIGDGAKFSITTVTPDADAVVSLKGAANGREVKVSVMLDKLPADISNIAAVTIEYTYDDAILTYKGTEAGIVDASTTSEAGKVYYTNSTGTTVAENNVTLVTLVFEAAEGLTNVETEVKIDFVELGDDTPNASKKVTIGDSAKLTLTTEAAPAEDSVVSMGEAAVNGREVKIPVKLDKLPADINNIAAATIEYTYDDAVLTYKGSEAGLLDVATVTEAGKAYWTAKTGAEVTGEDVTLFTLVFEAAEGLTDEETEVTITFAELGDDTPKVSKKVTIGDSAKLTLTTESAPAEDSVVSMGEAAVSGREVKIPVKLDKLPADINNIAAVTIEYTYEDAVLTYKGTEAGIVDASTTSEAGKVYYTNSTGTTVAENNVTLVTLVFEAAEGLTNVETEVKITFAELGDDTPDSSDKVTIGDSAKLTLTTESAPAEDSVVSMGEAAVSGREVKIPVKLDKLPADINNIAAVTIEYTYEDAVLTYKGTEAGIVDASTTSEAGKVYYTNSTGTTVAENNVTLVTLVFEAAEGLTNVETEVKITFAELGDDTPDSSDKVTIGDSAKLTLTTESAPAEDSVVSMGDAAVSGREVKIPVKLDKLPADINNIAAVTIEYTYEDAVLTYKGTEAGIVDASTTSEAGKVYYTNSTGTTVAENNVTLVTLVFEAAEGLTNVETEVKITFAELGDDTPDSSDKVIIGDSAKLTLTTEVAPGPGDPVLETIEATPETLEIPLANQESKDAIKAYVEGNITVTGKYDDNQYRPVNGYTVAISDDETIATITYQGKTDTIALTKEVKELGAITVTPDTLDILPDDQETVDSVKAVVEKAIADGDIKIEATYTNSADVDEITSGYTVEVSADKTKATIKYEGKEDTVDLNLVAKETKEIKVTPAILDILPDDQETVDSVKAVVEKAIADGDIKIEATYTNSADVDEITFGYTVEVSADKEKATVTYDGKTAEIDLNLVAKELKEIVAAPAAMEIAIADQESVDTVKAAVEKAIADGSIKLTATYTNSVDVDEITADYTVSISDDGTKATVTYSGKTADIALTYEQKILSGITAAPEALNVPLAEQGDIAAFVKVNTTVTASYENADDEVIAPADYEVAVSDDNTKATITYGDKTAEVALTLDTEAKAVTAIAVTPEEISVPYENQGSADDIKAYVESAIEAVTATYEDGSSINVASYEVSISEDGTKATVTYEDVSAEIALTMEPAPVVVESIETNTTRVSIDYDIWSDMTAEEIAEYIRNLTNFRIYANMSDDTQEDITDVADIVVDIDDEVATISYEGHDIELELNLRSKPSSGGGTGGKGSYGYKDIITPIVPGEIVTPEDDSMFDDIESDHYAYEAIKTLRERGFISGDGTNKVYPNIGITREETSKVAIAINNIDVEKGLPINYTDADQVSDWAVDYVGTAIDKGIMIGYGDGTLRPLNTVTRGEMVAIIIRSLGVQTDNTATNFSDVPAELWSAKYISAASQLGFVNGYEDGTFKPDQYITRAEAFMIYYRVLQFRDALTAAAIG